MKKITSIVILTFVLLLGACTNNGGENVNLENYRCKDTPLAEGCYIPSEDLNHISPIVDEYLINETFDDERVDSTPRNWLLYRNQEYAVDGVRAVIAEKEANRFLRMFSDGLRAPAFPQSAPTPTYILTTKFNLDIDRKGVAYFRVLIPSEVDNNAVSVGVSTGAVNTIGITIGKDLKLAVKVGGPFFYYRGTGDGGDTISTDITIVKDTWYSFKVEWDAATNVVSAYLVGELTNTLLHTGAFHISNRVNAEATGAILVPNVVRVTMPRYSSGWAYLDSVIVERKGE